ncbi:RNA polymerase II transcription factor B subunit 5 [Candida viswanathii]|uniref:General transcription and DNA repair factor IIH subunit TFB5 n=1 Tax=Candida viswanathii TaxID=5486 RepID=A0A367YFY0_9ASCO|nr:RNA polymerase II transcription factor B subunit 5 [Candida viswanathii]
MLVASKGVLVQCDPSIKALIIQIDSTSPGIILEELDETHLLIQHDKVDVVKAELNRLLSKNIYNPFEEE